MCQLHMTTVHAWQIRVPGGPGRCYIRRDNS
jgi:hypothetical protein